MYDRRWVRLVEEARLQIKLYMRYMDDGRKFLHPLKKGWRWEGGTLVYCLRWEIEDKDKTPMDITMHVLKETVKGVADYLQFTFESGEDYEDGWLPTLDTNIRVSKDNIVQYKYYEKPTTSNTTIHAASAMSENPKMQCLANDLVRRLLNTQMDLPNSTR